MTTKESFKFYPRLEEDDRYLSDVGLEGKIHIESKLGKRTTFIFTIPCIEDAELEEVLWSLLETKRPFGEVMHQWSFILSDTKS